MTNYYTSPEMEPELIKILKKVPEFQDRFLRLLQRNVIQGEEGFTEAMSEMITDLITEAYEKGKEVSDAVHAVSETGVKDE